MLDIEERAAAALDRAIRRVPRASARRPGAAPRCSAHRVLARRRIDSRPMAADENYDAIVVGAGLAGLVATAELADARKRVVVVDQEPEASLGGQAHWSLGGLLFVDSPEQRRARIKDSFELAWQDWLGTAGFDREEDHWPRKWAEAYVHFCHGEKRSWLHGQGVRWMPAPGWAERGGYDANGHGNSVPRFHLTWGTGPGVLAPFIRRVREAEQRGLVEFRFRHQVDELVVSDGAVTGVKGTVLEPSSVARGVPSSREKVGEFDLKAQAVVVTSGGIGANHDMVRRNWPKRLGKAAGAHGVRRARLHRRPHDRHLREGRRPGDQPRPYVALRGGAEELEPDLDQPRHPDHPRAVVAVARRHRQAPAGAAVPGLRHARHACAHHDHGSRAHLVRAQPEDHRARVRPQRVRAEPRRDRQGHPHGRCARGWARAPRRRSRRSRSTARTSWWSATCGRSWRG